MAFPPFQYMLLDSVGIPVQVSAYHNGTVYTGKEADCDYKMIPLKTVITLQVFIIVRNKNLYVKVQCFPPFFS